MEDVNEDMVFIGGSSTQKANAAVNCTSTNARCHLVSGAVDCHDTSCRGNIPDNAHVHGNHAQVIFVSARDAGVCKQGKSSIMSTIE